MNDLGGWLIAAVGLAYAVWAIIYFLPQAMVSETYPRHQWTPGDN